VAVVDVGRGDSHGQRQPGLVGQHVDLRTGFAAIDRTRPVKPPPFWP
jgi:hypothetical protein